jgi:hypothetical protein
MAVGAVHRHTRAHLSLIIQRMTVHRRTIGTLVGLKRPSCPVGSGRHGFEETFWTRSQGPELIKPLAIRETCFAHRESAMPQPNQVQSFNVLTRHHTVTRQAMGTHVRLPKNSKRPVTWGRQVLRCFEQAGVSNGSNQRPDGTANHSADKI